MIDLIPGTVLSLKNGHEDHVADLLTPLFQVTNGLTLSQVREMTGLESSTIQNWVKRGWVQRPEEKRYGETQVFRIILINSLRCSMQLDQIIQLMSYINGAVDDKSDDIISDSELFNILCKIICICDSQHTTDSQKIKNIILNELRDYVGPLNDSKNRLSKALLIMTLSYISGEIKKQAQVLLNILEE